MTRLVSLTLHAENLNREDVWGATSSALGRMEKRGWRVTVFVHPFHAIRASVDLKDRLSELHDRGHEIAQHTHYYSRYEQTDSGVEKRSSNQPEVIIRCLERDYEYLTSRGFRPEGFVSGGWAIHDAVFQWLRKAEFVYDCSFRTYELPYANPQAADGDDAIGPFERGGILELPTTSSLTSILWGGRSRAAPVGSSRYELWYLHDTDLLDPRKRALLRWGAPVASRGASRVTTGELAQIVVPELEDSPRGA